MSGAFCVCSRWLCQAAPRSSTRRTPKAAPPVAPITAGQVDDLLSPKVQQVDGNLFATVEPEQCSGVAKEVDPPFIFDLDPAATGGGHWMVDDGREVYIEEMVGVYRADYDAKTALSQANRTLQSCADLAFHGHRHERPIV